MHLLMDGNPRKIESFGDALLYRMSSQHSVPFGPLDAHIPLFPRIIATYVKL